MSSLVDTFRGKLSEELKAALPRRDSEALSVIRAVMSALDNAGALSRDEIARLSASSVVTEVPRRPVSREDIVRILDHEVSLRTNALAEFTRLGRSSDAELASRGLAVLARLRGLLSAI